MSIHGSFHGRGFVFCGGDKQFQMMATPIQSLRLKLHSQLLIQVFHMDENDLSPERQEYIRQMTNDIEVLDITYHLDNGYLKLKGWAIKPFAILTSKFEEAIFIDADAYFLRRRYLAILGTWQLEPYSFTIEPSCQVGAKDRIGSAPTYPSCPTYPRPPAHFEEQPLTNKSQALLSVCKMSSFWECDLSVYQTFYGDKDTFYIGFELVQEPYAFVRNYGGVIGELNPDDGQSICGAQMHLDFQGRPLWWNSGLVKNKNNDDMRDLSFGYWMSGGGNQTNRELFIRNDEMKENLAYELELDSTDDLPPPEERLIRGWKVEALPEDETERANSYVVMDKISKKVDSLIDQHKNVDPKGD
ncbi:hypothetical protein BGX30_010319 [Mortierella sp. GBA39]|nr:hypothetical protein BGX30_010319 [Mortierella sp. GBA39]